MLFSLQGCSKLEAENDDLRLQMEETEKIKRKLEEELEEVKSEHVLLAHHMINLWISLTRLGQWSDNTIEPCERISSQFLI